MKDESRNTIKIASRTIYFRTTEHGWAIIVMPDNFKVDNYYHGVHIHPDRKELPIHDPEINITHHLSAYHPRRKDN